jgi:hypothetical protein
MRACCSSRAMVRVVIVALKDANGRRCDERAGAATLVRAPLRGTAQVSGGARLVQLARTLDGAFTRVD